jgi:hypothetical protein
MHFTGFEDLRDHRDSQFAAKRNSSPNDHTKWKDPGRRYIKKTGDIPDDEWLKKMQIKHQQEELDRLN